MLLGPGGMGNITVFDELAMIWRKPDALVPRGSRSELCAPSATRKPSCGGGRRHVIAVGAALCQGVRTVDGPWPAPAPPIDPPVVHVRLAAVYRGLISCAPRLGTKTTGSN